MGCVDCFVYIVYFHIKKMTFADKVIAFNKSLNLQVELPENIKVMNPFQGNGGVLNICNQFYHKFYNDNHPRKLILGINPGRLGAGATGVPFTDTKRLKSHCQIEVDFHLHEPSSVFVYEVIDAFGQVKEFYKQFYINSICPLGFVIEDEKGRVKNYNYYDDKILERTVRPFIVDSIKKQIEFGIDTSKVFCMGTGKNFKFLKNLNDEYGFFGEVIPLEHPRYVMQYKTKLKDQYVAKYLTGLTSN